MGKTFSGCFFVLIVAACMPLSTTDDISNLDLTPPVLLRAFTTAPDRVVLEFNEPPVLGDTPITIAPALPVIRREAEENRIIITTAVAQEVGREYELRLTVGDTRGNSAWLIVVFYGHNPAPPRLLINEFITRGTSSHPDLVELKTLEGGNMGGVTFYCGTASRFSQRFVFPPFTVKKGDFILLHAKPQGVPEEIDETSSPSVSGGLDAWPEAYDFWLRGGKGLSGNNGALTLYDRPDGTLLDAVIYSTRSSESDVLYGGFGSAELQEQADEIMAAGGWQAAGTRITPEDAVNPDGSTATRSLCRGGTSIDTNRKNDFHIVPTKKASFGRENSDEVYVP